MRHRLHAIALLMCLPALLPFLNAGCVHYAGGNMSARYEKEVPLSAPLPPGSSFSAETRDGSITVEGTETSECTVLARVVTHAKTEEAAAELAEQIDVRLEPAGDGLRVVIDRPPVIRNAGYSVSLTARVPIQTTLDLVTADGSVRITNITGNVSARTSDGGIQVEDITGDTKLRTSDGSIACTRLKARSLDCYTSDGGIRITTLTAGSCTARTSDGSITLEEVQADALNLRTSDGSIKCRGLSAAELECHTTDGSVVVEYAPEAPKDIQLTATTSDGNITVAAPPGLSAAIEATTSDGSIHTSLPITVQGKVGRSLQGTIGGGAGKIYLKTHDGSITIR